MSRILLTTINAKWIHPSLALRLLKANLGTLEKSCEIIEFNLRQSLAEKTQPLLDISPQILGISVSIWNHLATIELLKEMEKIWVTKPVIVLGGPEVSHLPPDAEIFKYADYIIRGEGETSFRLLCESIFREDILLSEKSPRQICEDILSSENIIYGARGKIPAGDTEKNSPPPFCEDILNNEKNTLWAEAENHSGGLWVRCNTATPRTEGSKRASFNATQPAPSGVFRIRPQSNIYINQNILADIKPGYHLYTNEDLEKKLIYVESSRGCPFSCDFCLSAVKAGNNDQVTENKEQVTENREQRTGNKEKCAAVREFPLEPFFAQMDDLINRGVKTFKFLDRTFNTNIPRAIKICNFFLDKLEDRMNKMQKSFVVHFEMVPSIFPQELRDVLSRFPPGSLRLEIGIQTLNPEVAARINLPGRQNRISDTINEQILDNLRFLRENTNAIIHADLIAGLPGEDLASFGRGFDRLWQALYDTNKPNLNSNAEIQVGILKLLPGAPIARHNKEFDMVFNLVAPYEILENSSICASNMDRIKNFARFWELIINRGLWKFHGSSPVFDQFINLSDLLFIHFGRNWGIDKFTLFEKMKTSF